MEHGDALARLGEALDQRLENLRLDVLLPWAHLMHVQELADVRGARQAASRRALYNNLRLAISEWRHQPRPGPVPW